MNINLAQTQTTTSWTTDGNTIYLTMPIPSPSEILTGDSPNSDSYACPVCNVQFQTRSQLMGHTRKHMKDKLFQCKLCEANFSTHKELKSHMGGKTENQQHEFSITCGICGRNFPSQQCLTHHLNCHKQQGSAPVIIDNPSSDRSEYQIAIQVQGDQQLALELDPTHLQGQTLTVDPNQLDISQIQNVVVIPASPTTSTAIANIINAANNNQNHSSNGPQKREGNPHSILGLPTTAPPKKTRKRNANQKGAGANKGQQSSGANISTITDSLGNNISVEVLPNPNHRYSCSLCQKTFKNSQHVQRHLRIHTGEKPFTCQICSQSFSLNHNLQRHMRTHTGEKPHRCGVCQKEFAEGHNLKRHMISAHDGPTNYVCSICNRKFAENSILKKHMNKAHNSNLSPNQGSKQGSSGNASGNNRGVLVNPSEVKIEKINY